MFPQSGLVVMRNDWQSDSNMLAFDAGPQHLARLQVHRGLAGITDATGGAGEEQVARAQGDRL